MPDEQDDEHSHEDIKKQKEIETEKLWKNFQLDFQLEASKFPDNKIYGTIDIKPESARKLIRKLVLVVDKTNRIDFDSQYKTLCASGFNGNRPKQSVCIEAIPSNPKLNHYEKISKTHDFLFTGRVFTLSPTISFDLFKRQIRLLIRWDHIGDKYAHRYVLYLDGIEIQFIRQNLINDEFHVKIEAFEPGEKHTFQIASRLSNGKETYRSELVEFTVPKREQCSTGRTEVITITNDPIPPDLPAIVEIKEKPTHVSQPEEEPTHVSQPEEEPKPVTQPIIKTKPPPPPPPPKTFRCCNQLPHKTYPGIEHYLRNLDITNSNSEAGSGDDDDDVVIVTSKN